MANADVNITVKARDEASKEFNSITSSVQGMVGSFLTVGGALKAARASLDAFAVQESAVAQLNAALRASGDFSEENSQQLQNMAAQMQQVTTIGDETTLKVLALVTSLTGSAEAAAKLTPSIADMSAALGIDFQSAATLAAKAVEGNIGALSRYGIQVERGATQAETLANVQEALNAKFGGAAAAQVDTYAGQVQQLKNSFGDLTELIGEDLAKTMRLFIDIGVTGVADMQKAWLNLRFSVQTAMDFVAQAVKEVGFGFSTIFKIISGEADLADISRGLANIRTQHTGLREEIKRDWIRDRATLENPIFEGVRSGARTGARDGVEEGLSAVDFAKFEAELKKRLKKGADANAKAFADALKKEDERRKKENEKAQKEVAERVRELAAQVAGTINSVASGSATALAQNIASMFGPKGQVAAAVIELLDRIGQDKTIQEAAERNLVEAEKGIAEARRSGDAEALKSARERVAAAKEELQEAQKGFVGNLVISLQDGIVKGIQNLPTVLRDLAPQIIPELINPLIRAIPELILGITEAIPFIIASIIEDLPLLVDALVELIFEAASNPSFWVKIAEAFWKAILEAFGGKFKEDLSKNWTELMRNAWLAGADDGAKVFQKSLSKSFSEGAKELERSIRRALTGGIGGGGGGPLGQAGSAAKPGGVLQAGAQQVQQAAGGLLGRQATRTSQPMPIPQDTGAFARRSAVNGASVDELGRQLATRGFI